MGLESLMLDDDDSIYDNNICIIKSRMKYKLNTKFQHFFFQRAKLRNKVISKKNQNAPRPSEHPPVRGKKCQNV